jgi:hypothetical protein
MYNSLIASNTNTYLKINNYIYSLSLYYPHKSTEKNQKIILHYMDKNTFTHIHRPISTTLIF